MKALKILLGVLAAALIVEFIAAIALAVLVYQVTPKSILAKDTFIGRVPGLLSGVRVLDRTLNMFYRGPAAPEELPSYAIKVDPADLAKIEESLPTDLPSPWYGNVFLTEDAKQWAKATFTAEGKEYPVTLRVRGDIFNHWAYRKKSWRLKFPSDQLFRGIKELNLIIPEDRGWIAEPLNAYRAKQFGFVQPPMQFVTVTMNGSAPMIYTQIEQFSKEMLEKLARPGDVNVYVSGGGTSYFQQWDDVFADTAYWQKLGTAVAPPYDSFEAMEAVRRLSVPGAHALPGYRDRVQALFDVEQLATWYALALLAGSNHVRDHNVRFLEDVSRGRLEPIPWDVGLYWPRSFLSLPGNPFLNEVFGIPEWKLRAYRIVWAYVNDDKIVAADLAKAARLRSEVERAAYRDPLKLQSNRQVHADLNTRMAQVSGNIEFAKEQLKIAEVLVDQRVPSDAENARGLLFSVDATVRGVSPVSFAEISLPPAFAADIAAGKIQLLRDDGDFILDDGDLAIAWELRPMPDKNGRPVFVTKDESLSIAYPGEPVINAAEEVIAAPHTRTRFYLVRRSGVAVFSKEDLPLNLEFQNAVTGKKADVIGEVLIDERTFERLPEAVATRGQFLAKNPQFRADGADGILLQGNVTLNATVIIPIGLRLRVLPGTEVRMGKDVTLLSYSPVTIVGTEAAKIRFLAATPDPWGVFLVLNAKEQSEVAFAEFSDGREAFVNDAYATGMLAFHGSPVKIHDATFRNSHGDDALNIKYVPADLTRLRFENAGADALDIDMAPTGMLSDSTFFVAPGDTDSGGDGVDLSWSAIMIRNLTIEGSRDKCISVGESSKPTIEDVTLKGCRYGIAAKDGSEPTVMRGTFIDNDIAVTAYIKKSIFTQPHITIRKSTFTDNAVLASGALITIEP